MKKKGPKPLSWYRETYIKSGYRCAYCGRDLLHDFEAWMGIEVDHIVPISKGGSDKLSNRVAACSVCNGEKGRYLHPNHKRMTIGQILEAARDYVHLKRSAWHKVQLEAIEEFKKKRPTIIKPLGRQRQKLSQKKLFFSPKRERKQHLCSSLFPFVSVLRLLSGCRIWDPAKPARGGQAITRLRKAYGVARTGSRPSCGGPIPITPRGGYREGTRNESGLPCALPRQNVRRAGSGPAPVGNGLVTGAIRSWRALHGRDQAAGDRYWYDMDR